MSPPEAYYNSSRSAPPLQPEVIIVEKIRYTLLPKNPNKFDDKNAKHSHRGKRSLPYNEPSLNSDNLSQLRNKEAFTEPMYVSLMDALNSETAKGTQCNECLSQSNSADGLRSENGPSRVASANTLNNEKQAQPSQWSRPNDNGNIVTEKTSTAKLSTENDLQLKTQKYLDKLKKDFEALKSTIESKRQAALNRTAEAKAKLQKRNSLGKAVDGKLKQGIKQNIPKSEIKTKYNLWGKSDDSGAYVKDSDDATNENNGWKPEDLDLYDLLEDVMNANKYRQTRKTNSNANYEESSGFDMNAGNADSSHALGENATAKMLIRKLMAEPAFVSFIKDYFLRFVNVTAILEKENSDARDYLNTGELKDREVHEHGDDSPTPFDYRNKAGTVNNNSKHTKRSDGSRFNDGDDYVSAASEQSCGASPGTEHMCAHAANMGYIRGEKNSQRQKTEMEGVENVGHDSVSSFKLSHDESVGSKNLNTQEEQGTCKCSESPLNKNKYGIKANGKIRPVLLKETSSLVSNGETHGSAASPNRMKSPAANKGLSELKPFSNKSNKKSSHDSVKSSLLDDITELLQDQQCDCPRAQAVNEGV